jgi:hypothetical protein
MFESKINRGRANGYAPLGSTGKVPLDYLPPIQSTLNTGSFATTGSNIFTATQTISGSGDSSLTIGELNYYGGASFDLRVTGSDDSAITITSNVASLVGAIADTNDYNADASVFANLINGAPYSDGPTAGILIQKSGSFQSSWLFDYDGKSYFPGDVNIGYYTLNGLTSGSLNITKGNINVSGSVSISSSLVVSSTIVNNGTIDALNSDLIIDGGDIVLSGSMYFGSGSSITETSSSIIITPAGASAGQSLVVRQTAMVNLYSDHPLGFYLGDTITLTFQPDGNGAVSGSAPYLFMGCTESQLGTSLSGSLEFDNEVTKSLTWTIPALSDITGFTFDIYNFQYDATQSISLSSSGSSEHSHIHLVSGNPSLVDIYLGDDDQYVKIEKNAGDVVIGTNLDTHHWTFDRSGSLILPNDMVIDASVDFGILQIGGDSTYIKIDDGGAPPSLTIATNGGENEWVFGLDGNLTTPGDIVLSGSFAQQVNYAPFGSGSWETQAIGEVTELDITKDIHLLDTTGNNGLYHWYLPDGLYDGQVVRFALVGDNDTNPSYVKIWMNNLRTYNGTIQSSQPWHPFYCGEGQGPCRSLGTAIFIDGAWNIDTDWWDM